MKYPFTVYQPHIWNTSKKVTHEGKKWLCDKCGEQCGHSGPRLTESVPAVFRVVNTYKVVGENDTEYFVEIKDDTRDYERTFLDTLSKEGTFLTREEAEVALEEMDLGK